MDNKLNNTPKVSRKPASATPFGMNTDSSLKSVDVIAPGNMEVDFDYVKIGEVYLRTLFVGGYPRFVTPGWLEPIINFDHSMDISFYVYPVDGKSVLDDLRRKITEMEAEISTDIQRGKLINPSTQAKLEDARVLQEQLVKGSERFFEFSFYITIPAANLEELNQVTRQIQSTLGSLLVVAKKASLDMERAFLSTAPFGVDKLSITRNMDTTSLATTFPFTSAELSSDTGVLYGLNPQNESFIIFDRFSLENGNMTIFATAGAGKSSHYDEPVIYKNKDGKVQLKKIGELVEKIIEKGKVQKLEEEIEGVVGPNIQVFSFDKNLVGQWSDVTVAARKISPKTLYKFTTRSGREITVTGDHNLVVLDSGEIKTLRGDSAKVGSFIPLPREIKVDIEENNNVSKEWLTILGLITSEGCVAQYDVRIYNTDSEVKRIIRDDIKKLGFLTRKIYKYPEAVNVCGYSVYPCGEFRRKVIQAGAGGKSGTKRVPGFIFNLTNEQIAYYLRAYFEGDGGVESHEITATTKSKDLASDLSYLLLRFGIIVRIKEKRKAATNTKLKIKRTYYRISISGQDNVRKFIESIGFITETKNGKAQRLLGNSNTNTDTIPELQLVLKEIYNELYSSEIPAPKNFSEIKFGVFKPSRKFLLSIVSQLEKRIEEIEKLETDSLSTLKSLPLVQEIVERGRNKEVNRELWQKLDHSWKTMRSGKNPPYLANTLKAIEVTHSHYYSTQYVGGAVYKSFKNIGESLMTFDKALWSAVVLKEGNTQYERVLKARDYVIQKYYEKKERLRQIKEKVLWLKTLATSDLMWDPIVKIEKIKAKHKYVYDLQVDNAVFVCGHGGMFIHNSFFVKLEALRSLMLGAEVLVIDPENEYQKMAEAVGGEFINFSFNSESKINPFDLATVFEPGENQLGLKILSLHSLFKVIMGTITATQEAMLDRALIQTYRAKGITQDPATQTKEPPLMEDLYKTLIGMEVPDALDLAARLEKFVKGSFAGIFDKQTNINIRNPFTVFSVRDLQDILRPIAMFVILDFIWTLVKKDIKKRLLIVDEAWHMMRYPDTAQFLWSVVKRSRKYYLGLTTITQDVEDFLAQDIGKAIVTNSALRVLLKQSPAAIDKIGDLFYLSQGERQLLLAANVGEGIFFAGPHHAPIRVVASPDEYKLITTKPQEIAGQQVKV